MAFGGYGGYIATSQWVSAWVNTAPGGIPVLQNTINLINISDASKFWVGGWICIDALDLQSGFGNASSYPPNNHYFEFLQVSAINAGTGVLTLATRTRNGYSAHFPIFNDGSTTVGTGPSNGGPAIIWPFSPDWDMEQEILGIHVTKFGFQTVCNSRKIKFIDCQFDGQGPVPSVQQSFIMENCLLIAHNNSLELDKMVEYVRFTNVDFGTGGFMVQSSSIERLVVEGCKAAFISGTAKQTYFRDSFISYLTLGVISLGASEQVLIENCRINQIEESTPFVENQTPQIFGYFLGNWTFSDGTLSQPMETTTANCWAVPGRKMLIADLDGNFDSMGSPFMVLDVYQGDAAHATVTIDIASPAVVHWTSHGRSAGDVISFRTTGALPTGLYTNYPYYVLAAGLTSDAFELATTPADTPIVTTGSQSGTHTAYANPTFCIDTTLPSMPVGNSTNSTVTIDIATPALIHWTAHGLIAGTPVVFSTTGALPTGIDNVHVYYVIAAGLVDDAFEISATVDGDAINTSGTQSGTQTAIANPLRLKTIRCPNLTVRNSTGCTMITDLNNSPAGAPIYSYASRKYAGYDVGSLMSYQNPTMYVRGYLVSLTVNIERPYTGSGSYTFTVTAPAFDSSLLESDLFLTINAKVAGVRAITPAGVTGAQSEDILAAFGNWISGGPDGIGRIRITPTGGGGTFDQQPVFSITIVTDQGDVNSCSWMVVPKQFLHPDTMSDTTFSHGSIDN